MNTKFGNEINKVLKHGGKELKKTGTIKSKAYIFGDNRKVNVIPLFFSDHPIDKRLENQTLGQDSLSMMNSWI